MKNTIDIRPIYESASAVETGKLHYRVELNLYTDTCELADISFITESLTKCVKHMEYMLKEMEESRKGGVNNDK